MFQIKFYQMFIPMIKTSYKNDKVTTKSTVDKSISCKAAAASKASTNRKMIVHFDNNRPKD